MKCEILRRVTVGNRCKMKAGPCWRVVAPSARCASPPWSRGHRADLWVMSGSGRYRFPVGRQQAAAALSLGPGRRLPLQPIDGLTNGACVSQSPARTWLHAGSESDDRRHRSISLPIQGHHSRGSFQSQSLVFTSSHPFRGKDSVD